MNPLNEVVCQLLISCCMLIVFQGLLSIVFEVANKIKFYQIVYQFFSVSFLMIFFQLLFEIALHKFVEFALCQ